MIKPPECRKHPATKPEILSLSGIVNTTMEFRPGVPALYKIHRVTYRCNTPGCTETPPPGRTYEERIASHEAPRDAAQERLIQAIEGRGMFQGAVGWCPDCRLGLIEVFLFPADPLTPGSKWAAVQLGSNDSRCNGMCRGAQWEEV